MSKRILLLQFRDDQSSEHEQEKIITAIGMGASLVHCVNIITFTDSEISNISNESYAGIIIGGSGQYSISNWSSSIEAKISRVRPLISNAIHRKQLILGICFGHQLLAHWFGGKVQRVENLAETGTPQVRLTQTGRTSALYEKLPHRFRVVTSHQDSVTKLPPNATLLASSTNCTIQSFLYSDCAFGVQFHPELDKKDLLWRLNLYPEYIPKEAPITTKSYYSTPKSKRIVANFVKIALEKSN